MYGYLLLILSLLQIVSDRFHSSVISGKNVSASNSRNYVYAGGIVGDSCVSKINNCYNTGIVSSSDYAGGIAGRNFQSTITCCYNIGDISALDDEGGITGENSGTISKKSSSRTSKFLFLSIILSEYLTI